MGYSRNNEWQDDSALYTEEQIEGLLNQLGIEIKSETSTNFNGLCPFHHNTDDPAFTISKESGMWFCFNPMCGASGNLMQLIFRRKQLNWFQAQRLILNAANGSVSRFERAKELEAPDFQEFPAEVLERLFRARQASSRANEYLYGRGFTDDTLDFFEIGYSDKQDMTVVPMHDPNGMPVGMIGRSIDGKQFKNSLNLPKSKTMWNFHRAKRHGDRVIICESSFDAMRVHQAGYPNVVALLGGHITDYHIKQLKTTFSRVIIMTDNDEPKVKLNCKNKACRDNKGCLGHAPGRELGRSIIDKMSGTSIMWALYDNEHIYADNVKDASQMTDEEIRQCLRNAVSLMEYERLNLEAKPLTAA